MYGQSFLRFGILSLLAMTLTLLAVSFPAQAHAAFQASLLPTVAATMAPIKAIQFFSLFR